MNPETVDFLLQLGDAVLRAVLSLAVLFCITRVMGKKQISQLTFFDYVVGISIGSLAAEMATNTDVPYWHGVTAIFVYGLIALEIAVLTNKSVKARRFFTGCTFLLIDRGRILEQNLMKVKYDVNDLLSEARNAGYFNIADVEYALLETNGKISFLPKTDRRPATLSDLNIQKPQEGLCANVIIDGKIMQENLKATGLDESWLRRELNRQNTASVSDVILATVDPDRQLSVYPKTHQTVKKTPID